MLRFFLQRKLHMYYTFVLLPPRQVCCRTGAEKNLILFMDRSPELTDGAKVAAHLGTLWTESRQWLRKRFVYYFVVQMALLLK